MSRMQRRMCWAAAFMGLSGCVVALAVAWLRAPTVLYIHVYSNRYDIESMGDLPPPPRPWQRIATLSITSGVHFFAQFPGHYEPRLQFDGIAWRNGDSAAANFSITAEDVGTAIQHRQESDLPLNVIRALSCDGCEEHEIEFRFCISDSPSGDNLLSYGTTAPRLSQQEAMGIATRAAIDAGFAMADYNPPRVDHMSESQSGTWWVFFAGKHPAMRGSDFTVAVQDKTGTATVMRGK